METKEIRDVAIRCLSGGKCDACKIGPAPCTLKTKKWLLSLCDEVERLRLSDVWSKAPDEADRAIVQFVNGAGCCPRGIRDFKREVKTREREIAEKYAEGDASMADIIEAAIMEAKK